MYKQKQTPGPVRSRMKYAACNVKSCTCTHAIAMVASQHRCYFNGIMMGTQRNDDAIRLSVFLLFSYTTVEHKHTQTPSYLTTLQVCSLPCEIYNAITPHTVYRTKRTRTESVAYSTPFLNEFSQSSIAHVFMQQLAL